MKNKESKHSNVQNSIKQLGLRNNIILINIKIIYLYKTM